jgi:hypothetical protein
MGLSLNKQVSTSPKDKHQASSPPVSRGAQEGLSRLTAPSSAAATERSEGAVGWSEWLGSEHAPHISQKIEATL